MAPPDVMSESARALKHISHQIRGALAVLNVALQPGMLDEPEILASAKIKLAELDAITGTLDSLAEK